MVLVTYRGNNGGILRNCKLVVCSPEVAQGILQMYWHIMKILSSLSFIQVSYYVFSIFPVGQGFSTSYVTRDKDGHSKQRIVPEENQSGRLWSQKWNNKSIHKLFLLPPPRFFLFLRFSSQCLLLGQKHSYQQHRSVFHLHSFSAFLELSSYCQYFSEQLFWYKLHHSNFRLLRFL